MTYIDRPGARIFYEFLEVPGSTQTVVTLVNGHTRSSGDFRMMARHLNSAGISCIILDNRASGRSEVSESFTLKDMQEDILAIWRELDISRSHLLGISMGGFICQGIAIHAPQLVDRLALISTAADPKWIKSTGGGWMDSGTMVEDKLASYFAPGFVESNPILFQTMVKQTKTAIAAGSFTEKSNMQRDALAGVSWASQLKSISATTLIIHGSLDQVVDVQAANELAAFIPNSKLRILEGIGHLILAESPKVLYQMAIEFFSADQL